MKTKKYFYKFIPYVIIIIMGLVIFSRIFSNGYMVFKDNPVHIAKANFFMQNLIPEQGGITGWCPYDFAGFPFQVLIYQLYLWLVSGLSLIFGLSLGYKLAVLTAYIFPSIALFILLKKHFNIFISTSCSILFLLQTQIISKILEGMWSRYLALGFFILLLNFMIDNKLNNKKIAIMSFLFFLTIVTHIYVGIASFIIIGFMILKHVIKKEYTSVFQKLIVLFVGFLTSSFYLVPIIKNSKWMISYFSQTTPLSNILTNLGYLIFKFLEGMNLKSFFYSVVYDLNFLLLFKIILLSLPSIIIFILGIVGAWRVIQYYKNKKNLKRYENLLIISFLLFITSILFITEVGFLIPPLKDISFFNSITSSAFVIYSRLSLLIFSAYLLSKIRFTKSIKTFFIISLLFLSILTYVSLDRNWFLLSKDQEIDYVMETYAWVKDNIDGTETRILLQSFSGNSNPPLKFSHLQGLSVIFTGVNYLGGWWGATPYPTHKFLKTSGNLFLGKDISELNKDYVIKTMILFNSKYVMTVNNKTHHIYNNPDSFKKEYSNKEITIFSVVGYNPSWVEFEHEVPYQIESFKDDSLIMSLNNTYKNNSLLLKIQYHSGWELKINGKRKELSPTEENLMFFYLEEGENHITLKYNSKDFISILLTLAGIGAVIFLYLKE